MAQMYNWHMDLVGLWPPCSSVASRVSTAAQYHNWASTLKPVHEKFMFHYCCGKCRFSSRRILLKAKPLKYNEASNVLLNDASISVVSSSMDTNDRQKEMYDAEKSDEGETNRLLVMEVSRKLLVQASSLVERRSVLDEYEPSWDMCRKLLTILDKQDAPDIALEVCAWRTRCHSQEMESATDKIIKAGSFHGQKSIEKRDVDAEKTILWTKAMKMFSKRRNGALKALRVYDKMKEFNVRMDVVSFNTAIAAAGDCGRWKRIANIRKEMKKSGIKPDGFTYMSLLGGCKATGNWKQSIKLFREMQEYDGLTPNVFHYTTLMTTLQRSGAWEESLKIFKRMEADGIQADVVSYNAAITACAKGSDWQQAWSIFSTMRRNGVEPTVISYNALISACERCGQVNRALEVFYNMKKRGIECNQVTYNTLILSCGKSGLFDRACEIHQEMKDNGIREDAFTQTALLAACNREGDWKRALVFMSEFRNRGVTPNIVAFNQLITMLGDNFQWRRAIAAWDAMAEEGIEPDIVTYGAMLSALEKAGQWREALDLYDRLLADSSNIKPNLYIYSSVLNACEKGRQWDRATELFKAMLEIGNEELVPMSSIAILARKAIYASPAILSALPDPLVTAAKSVVDTGRAARQWIWQSSSSSLFGDHE